MGSGEPEHGPLLSPVKRQSDAQQRRVRQTDRLSAFDDCHDDVGCQAREVEQAIEPDTTAVFQPRDGRDGLVGVAENQLARLVDLAHQAHQFRVTVPEPRFVDWSRNDQSKLPPMQHPGGGAGELDRSRFAPRIGEDTKRGQQKRSVRANRDAVGCQIDSRDEAVDELKPNGGLAIAQ